MIDSVRLSAEMYIPDESFRWSLWRRHTYRNGTLNYFVHQEKVWMRYYPDAQHLLVDGKLLTLLYDTDVLNVDDCYGNNMEAFLTDINDCLNQLFTQPLLDIRTFRVTRLDYCFNVKTPYVTTYINFLNQAFRMVNNGNKVNYVQEKKLTGSVYIKTKHDYDHNERRNYVLNFYDKSDWLAKQRITHPLDFDFAKDVLRMEVQCGYQFIKQLCKEYRIANRFELFLSYEIAFWAEEIIYNRIFKENSAELDFFTYNAAKKRLTSPAAKKTLLFASQGKRITTAEHTYGRKLIRAAGIFPFCFLPRNGDITTLLAPLKLLKTKINNISTTAKTA